jgi:hypothetical protein
MDFLPSMGGFAKATNGISSFFNSELAGQRIFA